VSCSKFDSWIARENIQKLQENRKPRREGLFQLLSCETIPQQESGNGAQDSSSKQTSARGCKNEETVAVVQKGLY